MAPTQRSRRDTLATKPMVITTSLVVALGGIVFPILGWIAGIVMTWLSPAWTTGTKWLATLAPLATTAIIGGIIFATTGGQLTLLHVVILIAVVGPILSGIWLLVSGLRSFDAR